MGISLKELFPGNSAERKDTTDNSALSLFLSSAKMSTTLCSNLSRHRPCTVESVLSFVLFQLDGPPQAKKKNTNLEWTRMQWFATCYSSKGSLEDRTCPVEWLLDIMVPLHGEIGADKIDKRQQSLVWRVEVWGTNQTSLQHLVDNE